MPRLHYHPFAQYCQKVLIALHEHDLAIDLQLVNLMDPAEREALKRLWPFGQFPVLERDDGSVLGESGVIIEYLDTLAPDRQPMVPVDRIEALEPRMLERVVNHKLADATTRIIIGRFMNKPVDEAAELATISTAYDFLEQRLAGRTWLAGEDFGLADCAAGPALFYANLLQPIGDRALLAAYFAQVAARPSFAAVIDEARPYRDGTPFDWPATYP
jgi:glutathione S-transferase